MIFANRVKLLVAHKVSVRGMVIALVFAATSGWAAGTPLPAGTFGTQEHVAVQGATLEIIAVLDPNAPTSLLYAYGISYFTGADGNTWASFTLDNGSVVEGHLASIKAPVLKDYKQHVKNGARAHRPMVDFSFCLADKIYTTTVELLPRNGYTPPLVLGAEAMKEIGAVQAGRTFTVEPNCTKPADASAPPPKP